MPGKIAASNLLCDKGDHLVAMWKHMIPGLVYILFPAILALTLFIYWPGLSGVFLLDDIPNLQALGEHASKDPVNRFLLFLLSGDSGPTGRPVSLLSFYINDSAWPGDPVSFKYTNLLIHVLNGCLVFWLGYLLLTSAGVEKSRAGLVSAIAMLLWVTHPIQVSTTLYVIQRMTQLSTLFTLCALITWLYGRNEIIRHNNILSWRTILGLLIFGLLALLSKENGALIPAYMLAIEVLLWSSANNASPALRFWNRYLILLPVIILVAYITYRGLSSDTWLVSRPYTFTEHLLSEFHALSHYISVILFPQMQGLGLFHDDFPVSSSILEPVETLFSIIFLGILCLAAVIFWKRARWLGFAVAWFFAGHLMESTVLPLELYFEHRNYLAMYGILLGISFGLVSLLYRNIPVGLVVTICYTGIYIFITYNNTILWGKPLEAAHAWAEENPESIRAQMTARSAIKIYARRNRVSGERYHIQKMLEHHPDRANVLIAQLDFKCLEEKIDSEDISNLSSRLASAKLHVTDLTALQALINNMIDGRCHGEFNPETTEMLLSAVMRNSSVQYPLALHIIHYTYGQLYAATGDLDNTMHHLELAYEYKPILDIKLLQALYLQSAGLHEEALDILYNLLNDDSPLDHKLRQQDIQRLISVSKAAARKPEISH